MLRRLLSPALLVGLAVPAVAQTDCPAPSRPLGDGICLILDPPAADGARRSAARAMADSVSIAFDVRTRETEFAVTGEPGVVAKLSIAVYAEWTHVPGTPYYSLEGRFAPILNGPHGAGFQRYAPTTSFPLPIEAAPGRLVHRSYIVTGVRSPDNDDEAWADIKASARASAQASQNNYTAVYASLDPALTADVAIDPDSADVGVPFEAVVTVANPWVRAATDVRPAGPPVVVTASGEPAGGAVEVTATPEPLAQVSGGGSGVLRYTLVARSPGAYTITAPVEAEWPRYYNDTVQAQSLCVAPAGPCTVRVGGFGFTAESAFMKEDSLFWPDTTYTLRWTPGEAQTVEIHASLLRHPDPANDAHWPIEVATGLDATTEAFVWTVPVEATSPTVHLRLRDADDAEIVDVSERARVRYGWHLTRIATDPSGEQRYEAFDPTRHGWREDAPDVMEDWIGAYYTDLMLGVHDSPTSAAAGTPVEMDVELDYLLGEKGGAYAFGASPPTSRPRTFVPVAEYLEKRRDRAERSLYDIVYQGTPSWRSVAFAYGDQTLYGQSSPVLVPGPSENRAVMSQIHPGVALDYAVTISTGKGMCYGLSWSALLMFHAPEAFADWYRPLHPGLQPVRELSAVPLDHQALDVIGAVFTAQSMSGSAKVKGTVEELQASLESDDPGDDRILSNEYHAVLPYRVEAAGPETVQIRVHNRTYPGRDESSSASVFEVVDGVIDHEYGFTGEAYTDFLKPVPLSSDTKSA